MRIVIIGPSYPFRGGIAQHTSLLANELIKHHDVKFISYTRQYPKFIFPGQSDKDYESSPLFTGKIDYIIDSINPITLIKAIYKTLKYSPHILILPWWVTYWAPHYIIITNLIRLFSDIRIVFICHNVIEHESSLLKKLITKFALKSDICLLRNQKTKRTNYNIFFRKNKFELLFTQLTKIYTVHLHILEGKPMQNSTFQAQPFSSSVLLDRIKG